MTGCVPEAGYVGQGYVASGRRVLGPVQLGEVRPPTNAIGRTPKRWMQCGSEVARFIPLTGAHSEQVQQHVLLHPARVRSDAG